MKSKLVLFCILTSQFIIVYMYLKKSSMTKQLENKILLSYGITMSDLAAYPLSSPAKVDIKVSTLRPADNVSRFPPTIVNGTDINPDIARFFTLRSNETKGSFINLHRYEFNLNSQICSKGDLFLIMVVHSAPGNYKKRELIRTTYGSVHIYKGKKMAVVFMLGNVTVQSLETSIHEEANQHRDIVQGNFQDSYRNLNRKHIMAMNWFNNHCKAEFILKLDDDTFINPFRIMDYIHKQNLKGMIMHCELVLPGKPVRSPGYKSYTPESEYPFYMFPSFCLGFAYLTTPEAWNAMYKASENNRFMSMDDVYVSGVLALQANVGRVNMHSVMYECPGNVSLISVENLNTTAVFLDRSNRCGQIPFTKWENVRNLNKDL